MGDLDSFPGLGRSPGGGHATPSSILAWRIPTDRGAWPITVHGVAKSQTRLSELITAHSTVVKNPPANAGDIRNKGLFPGLGRSPGEGNGNPLQYSCLENPMNSMKRQKDRTLNDEFPRLVSAQYATGDQWRNNSRKNERMEPKQKRM